MFHPQEITRIGQEINSEQTLQSIIDKIRDAAMADFIVLCPYETALRRFIPPPLMAGELLDSTVQPLSLGQLEDSAERITHVKDSHFAKDCAIFYKTLHGGSHSWMGNFSQREKVRSIAAVPLQVGDELVGVLFVNFRQPQRFDAAQKLFIDGLGHYAAIAIKNVRVLGTIIHRHVRELEILQNIDRELSRNLELEPVLDTLLKLATEQVPADGASVLLYNSLTQALETAAAIGLHKKSPASTIPFQASRGITRWALEHKKPVRVDNIQCDPLWRDIYIPTAAESVSELDVPLLDDDEVVGVLNFESIREGAFRQEDEDFLLTLAGQAVLAIKNAQTFEREKRLVAEGQLLNNISKEITSQLDLDHVFELILGRALDLTNSHMGNLMLYDPEQGDLWMATQRDVAEDKRGKRQGLDEGIVGAAATKKVLLNVADVTQPPWNEIFLQYIIGTRSELAVPMLAGDEIRGVLNIESPNPNNFNERDERLLQGLADLAVVALQNAQLYEQSTRQVRRLDLLYQAGQELGKINELAQLDQAYDATFQIAKEYNTGQVVIHRYDEGTQELMVFRISDGLDLPPFPRIKPDEGIDGQIARDWHSIRVHDNQGPEPHVVPASLPDPMARSFVITPIVFNERYYGNLGLYSKEVGHFRDPDVQFLEGLKQQLASTIYRLETVQERQEFEHRAKSAEVMSSIGQIAFELTHRWGNDLGLVRSYVNDIRSEMKMLQVTSPFITEKLENIIQAAAAVLNLSKELKQAIVRTGEAIAVEPVVIVPRKLLEEAQDVTLLPTNIQISLEIDDDVAEVRVVHNLVADILRNLITNAIDALPDGGKIALKAHNVARYVALEVIDTGVGIPEKSIPKVFDLFYSTKGSSGFGLWSARTNALRNQGDLTVSSQEGQGTTFTLFLPRADK